MEGNSVIKWQVNSGLPTNDTFPSFALRSSVSSNYDMIINLKYDYDIPMMNSLP